MTMFDQVILIYKTQQKNSIGVLKDIDTEIPVQATMQEVSRTQRTQYQQEGLNRAVRFQFMLLNDNFDLYNITHFKYNGVLYSVKDITKDKTNTHAYIEGVTGKGL